MKYLLVYLVTHWCGIKIWMTVHSQTILVIVTRVVFKSICSRTLYLIWTSNFCFDTRAMLKIKRYLKRIDNNKCYNSMQLIIINLVSKNKSSLHTIWQKQNKNDKLQKKKLTNIETDFFFTSTAIFLTCTRTFKRKRVLTMLPT